VTWRRSLLICALLTIAPLFLTRHLPFCDLPEHVAVIATLRHWWDPAWRSQELYAFAGAGKTQYLLYYVVGALLAVPFGNAETANLAMLCAVGVGFPYALRELLRALGRDERLAVFACPLFWNRALAEGLVNYVASIPLAVWGIALAARQAEEPTRRRFAGLALLSLALFYVHLGGFIVFAAGAVLVTAVLATRTGPKGGRRFPGWRSLAGLAWLAPCAVASAAFALTSAVTHPERSQGAQAGVVRFTPTLFLLRELPAWMHDFWRSWGDDACAAVAWVALASLLVGRVPAGTDDGRRRLAGAGLFALALALYFFLPAQVSFAFLLDVRNAPFVGLFATLLVPARAEQRARWPAIAMTAAAALLAVHGAWQMHAYDRDEARDFDEVLRNLPRGKRLLSLVFQQRSAYANVTPFVHFGAYYRIRYGGIASFSFAELPHWPVQYRPEQAPPRKQIVFWDWSPCLYRNTKDGPYFDFVMARGELDPFAGDPPGPRWRAIGGAGEWRLWARDAGAGSTRENAAAEDPGPCPR